ncbi:MAG: tRNA pseudouridine(38-40) synthase TruA [Gammaproteobacteria bacterium]|nr:tRNA pseudouridine(38-40) synthase TruA [Gammaproteobacteria bacterium]
MRVALALEYDGSDYCGWQRQPHCHSVQAEVEQALSKVANEPITVHCSGRTDTGVHAAAQIVHFDTQAHRPMRAWTFGVNSELKRNVSVHWAKVVNDEFHARFKALNRRYRYSLLNRPTRPGLYHRHLAWERSPLDVESMQRSTKALLGTHDFSSFRSSDCQAKHAVRELYELSVVKENDLVFIDVCANGFLHNMVRILTGCLLKIGKGEQSEDWLAELLIACDRTQSGMTAPAQGLCFIQPEYPAEFGIPDFRSKYASVLF